MLDDMLEILETYLRRPRDVAPLLALLTGRVHLASQTHTLTARLSNLFAHYLRQLPLTDDPPEKMALAPWCYQLANAFFVAVQHSSACLSWVQRHLHMLNEVFTEGAEQLITIAPVFLTRDQVTAFESQMRFLLVSAAGMRL